MKFWSFSRFSRILKWYLTAKVFPTHLGVLENKFENLEIWYFDFSKQFKNLRTLFTSKRQLETALTIFWINQDVNKSSNDRHRNFDISREVLIFLVKFKLSQPLSGHRRESRPNLTSCPRITRVPNDFSKKPENFRRNLRFHHLERK